MIVVGFVGAVSVMVGGIFGGPAVINVASEVAVVPPALLATSR